MKNRVIKQVSLNSVKTDWLSDGGYQRKLDSSRVKKIARNFNEALIDTPLIADRNGELFVVDGQHTIAVLLHVGIDSYPCAVMESSGRNDEAPVFIAANSTGCGRGKSVTPFERHTAGILCGDAIQNGMKDLFCEFGVEIVGSKSHSKNTTIAIGVIEELYKSGRVSLRRALEFIASTWADDCDRWSADIIRGAYYFCIKLNDDDLSKAAKRLKKYSCRSIIDRAATMAKSLDTHRRACMPDVFKSLSKI